MAFAIVPGAHYGRLTVIAEAAPSRKHRRAIVRCTCGTETTAQIAHLRAGRTTSCGCYRVEQSRQRLTLRWESTPRQPKREPQPRQAVPRQAVHRSQSVHGHAKGYGTPEYRAWRGMIERCRNPKRPNYQYYGGRGIRVCDAWQHNFPAFLAHIGLKPSSDLSLDRIDTNGHYEPGNVRWADARTQTLNRRITVQP